jgi:hypothetical protein
MWLDPPNAHTVDAAGLQICGYAAICRALSNEVCVKGFRRAFPLIFVSGITEGRWAWMHGTTSASHRDNIVLFYYFYSNIQRHLLEWRMPHTVSPNICVRHREVQ